MNRYLWVVGLTAMLFFGRTAAALDVTWDGGTGNWNDFNWNGTQDPLGLFGSFEGVTSGSSPDDINVFINSGNVAYDGETFGDFIFTMKNGPPLSGDFDADTDSDGHDFLVWQRGGSPNGAGAVDFASWENDFGKAGPGFLRTFNISGGATWSQDSYLTSDGIWTPMDAAELNIDGVGSKLIRTFSGTAQSGGAFILGSWKTNSLTHPTIAVNLTNGGTIQNDDQLWFGAANDSAADLEVNMTINDGHLDLTGGQNGFLTQSNTIQLVTDLLFVDNFDPISDEKYTINFTGPGSITVDRGGIAIAKQNLFGSFGSTPFDKITYLDLWNEGILQVNGMNDGLESTFNANFMVTGTTNTTGGIEDDNYTLTSLLTAPVALSASFATIPEPAGFVLAGMAVLLVFTSPRRRVGAAERSNEIRSSDNKRQD